MVVTLLRLNVRWVQPENVNGNAFNCWKSTMELACKLCLILYSNLHKFRRESHVGVIVCISNVCIISAQAIAVTCHSNMSHIYLILWILFASFQTYSLAISPKVAWHPKSEKKMGFLEIERFRLGHQSQLSSIWIICK